MQNTMALRPTLRLVFSAAMIFTVLAAVAGVSGALLTTNPAIATDHTFSTATANLLISHDTDDNGPDGYDTSVGGFVFGNMAPGDEEEFVFWLKNDSSAEITLNLFADLSDFNFKDNSGPTPVDLGATGSGTDIDSNLEVKFTCISQGAAPATGSTPSKTLLGTGGWTNSDTTGKEQMDEDGTATLAPSDPTNGSGDDEARCIMTVKLREAATSADHSATFDAVFTGEQIGTI